MPDFKTHNLPPAPKPKRARKKPNPLDKSLKAIYQSGGRRMPDLTLLERARKPKKRKTILWLVAGLALLALVGWGVFFFLQPGGDFSGARVILEVAGPDEVKIGDEVTYVITYKNEERLTLGKATLELIVPKELQDARYSVPSTINTTWQLGTLGKDAGGEIMITGKIMGNIGTPIAIQAKLIYTPSNFNAEFEKIARKIIELNDSTLGLAIEGPSEVLPGDAVTYKISTSSTVEQTGVLRVTLPEHFTATAFDPKPTEGVSEWIFPDLKPGEEKSLTVTGSFDASAQGEFAFAVVAGARQDQNFVALRRQSLNTKVSQSDLELSQVVNGSADATQTDAGEVLHYSIRYKNRGNDLLSDVSLSLVFRGASEGSKAPLEWVKLEDELHGRVRDGVISWDRREIRRLSGLKPNDEGTIDISIPIEKDPIVPPSDRNIQVVSVVEARIGATGERKEARVVRASPLVVTVGTQARLSAAARYYSDDNEAVGTGPVPPKVGEKTTYRIYWQLTNALHEISDIMVVTGLPGWVEWTGKNQADAGGLSFNETSRKILWTINRMPTSVTETGAWFEVAITPGADDVGKEIALTDETTLTAKDIVTDRVINRVAPAPTTDLEGDPEVSGKGVVIK